MKRVCICCGSNPGYDKVYSEMASALVDEMASRGLSIVYGGARVGLMGTIAERARGIGVKITGVIPEYIHSRGISSSGLDELIVAPDMRERKKIMDDLSDGYIAMPGGFGTLDEFFEALTLLQLGIHSKPCAVFNVNEYFNKLLAFTSLSEEEGFIRPENNALIIAEHIPSILLDRMMDFRRPSIDKWIDEKK